MEEIHSSPDLITSLARLGYRFYSYSAQGVQHYPDWADVPSLNVVCCHPGSRSAIARTMCAPGSH